MLLDTDNMGRTAWHLAVREGNIQLLHKIWETAEEYLTAWKINNKFLLAQTIREGPPGTSLYGREMYSSYVKYGNGVKRN